MATRKRPKNQGITIIKKANDLIEARYKFDVWETRFFLSVLSQIRREDSEFQTYRVWYKDVIKTFGFRNHNAYDLLRQAAASLMRKVFTVNYEEDGFTRQITYHIIRKTDVLHEGQENKVGAEKQEYIDVIVEHEMKPLLLQLQRNFTAYELRNVVKLGVYPMRIYELLKQYESIGERTLGVDDMKKMFELEAEYSRFPNFNQRVIIPAVKEINRHTDIHVREIEKIKSGRGVTSLRFRFGAKTQEQTKDLHRDAKPPAKNGSAIYFPEPETAAVAEAKMAAETAANPSERDRLFQIFYEDVVQKFGVTPSGFLELLEKHTEEEVNQAIRVTRRAKANDQIKSSVPGFFVHALKNGYTDPKEEAEKKKRREAEKLELQKQWDDLQHAYSVKINDQIRLLLEAEPNLRTTAIEQISVEMADYIHLKYPDEPPATETFRQDTVLRAAVIQAIINARRVDFLPIENEFLPQLENLRKQIESK